MVLGIMISKQCNFHCGHCMVNSSHKYSWMEDGVLNKFYELVEYNRPDDVYILGGAPLLHIEIIEENEKMENIYQDVVESGLEIGKIKTKII